MYCYQRQSVVYGIFGTLLQLIKYSKVGADVNINRIQIPPILIESKYDLDTYLQMYLTTSFVLTAPESNCEGIIEIFKEHGLDAQVIGNIIKESVADIWNSFHAIKMRRKVLNCKANCHELINCDSTNSREISALIL